VESYGGGGGGGGVTGDPPTPPLRQIKVEPSRRSSPVSEFITLLEPYFGGLNHTSDINK